MKNILKFLGFAVITIILIVNCFLLNKQIEQGYKIEYAIRRLDAEISNNNRNTSTNTVQQIQKPAAKEIMSPLEVANYLQISMDKVYEMVQNKTTKIPYIYVDGEYRFNKAAIDEWMKTPIEITFDK